MSEPQFHLKLLSNYQLVTKPGTYYVSTAYTVNDRHLIMDDHPRYIVPFRAITGDGLSQIITALNSAADGLVPFSQIRHLFLSGALWYTENDLYSEEDLPIQGEKILATFDYVVDKNEQRRLLCTHTELLPREELGYVDINDFDQFRSVLTNLISKTI